MNTKLVNAASIDEKENLTEKKNPNDIDCISPSMRNCINMLVDLKNCKRNMTSKSFVLTDNNTDYDEPPVIPSPIKFTVPLEGAKQFCFRSEVNSTYTSAAEIITTNSTNSLSSTASRSSVSSQKRTESNDCNYPQSKLRSLTPPDLPTSFLNVPILPKPVSRSSNHAVQSEKTVCCNCKKSHCLKLYCECFKAKGFCSANCFCIHCYNNPEHEEDREEAIQQMLSKNPHCFDSHVDKRKGINKSGCRCRKTHCDKRYCECFRAGVPCGDQCQCKDCKNHKLI